MTKKTRESFFSISFDLISCEKPLGYDLYINSSTHKTNEKFIRIFPSGETLAERELELFKKKYFQLYVLESQRKIYLDSIVHNENAKDVEKTEVIKGSAIQYLEKIFDSDKEFTNEVLNETVRGCKDAVDSMVEVIQDYSVDQVQDLIGELSFHDFYTYDHSINVSMYSISIYKALKENANREEMIMAGMGGLLHDIGKIKISTSIINNPGKLSEEDYAIIKKHPEFGNELMCDHNCEPIDGVNFEIIRRVVMEHHENVNGTGYPNNLKGADIHIMARVTAIADFYDAITTKRSYHEVLSTSEALEVMSRSVGRKIDPKIFEVFSKNVTDIVGTSKGNKELPDGFDPCQPHKKLPFEKVSPKTLGGGDFLKNSGKDYGKVHTGKKKAS
jgi:HD-GYP domain-containing protein (c-di-GMP phosphodiesterase class II)